MESRSGWPENQWQHLKKAFFFSQILQPGLLTRHRTLFFTRCKSSHHPLLRGSLPPQRGLCYQFNRSQPRNSTVKDRNPIGTKRLMLPHPLNCPVHVILSIRSSVFPAKAQYVLTDTPAPNVCQLRSRAINSVLSRTCLTCINVKLP